LGANWGRDGVPSLLPQLYQRREGTGDGNEREIERKGTVRSKEKRETKGKGGRVHMKYVSRIVEVRYWQPHTLAP